MSEIKPIFHALTRNKVGAILLLAQIAITTAIVSNAAFIIADRVAFLNQPTGYPEEELFSFSVKTYGDDVNASQQVELDEQLLREIPGVIDAFYSNAVPVSGSGSSSSFNTRPDGEDGGISIVAAYYQADEHIFNTLGVELIEGRNFTEDEVTTTSRTEDFSGVAIVSQEAAKRLFEGESALGKSIYWGGMAAIRIIGVTGHMTAPWLNFSGKNNTVILPFILPSQFGRYIVRTRAEDQAEVMSKVEQVILGSYRERVVSGMRTMTEGKRNIMDGDLLMTRMLITLIVILVLVTALGIFGLTLFNISKRTKQIGTRRALGARRSAILRYFLTENAMISLAGVSIGGLLAWGLGKQLMELYSVPALSWHYVAFTIIAMLLMSLLAVLEPARRATAISPSIATRSV